MKKEFARLTLPDEMTIPPELTNIIGQTSSSTEQIDQVAPSPTPPTIATTTALSILPKSDANQTSEDMTTSASTTDEHSVQSKSSTTDLSTTLIDSETQQSSNSSSEPFDQQHQQQQQSQSNLSPSTNANTYDVATTHSNSLLLEWTTTDPSNVPLTDDGLIYDDLLDDEDDLDDDLDVEDMLEYEGDIAGNYPEDFY